MNGKDNYMKIVQVKDRWSFQTKVMKHCCEVMMNENDF